jgi:hypothetical protein
VALDSRNSGTRYCGRDIVSGGSQILSCPQ